MSGAREIDAVLFDAGGVLVLPDPTVLGPLLAPYGGDPSVDAHRRAHYAAMSAKSLAESDEWDWEVYNTRYVRSIGIDGPLVDHAAEVLDRIRHPLLWRWPIPETLTALAELSRRDVPIGVVSNAAGQIEDALRIARVCQIGPGDGIAMRVIVDSHIVGVAKPDPRIFDHALGHFEGIALDRIAYIGDSIRMDVGAASAAGLRPFLIDPYDDHDDGAYERIAEVGDILALV